MKILLTGKHVPNGPRPIGGVQSWIATVALELKRLRHTVDVWGPELGAAPGHRFDAAIVANLEHCSDALKSARRFVNVSHGIIPAERPFSALPVVCTSEGVRDHWKAEKVIIDACIVRQPIDLAFWTPGAVIKRAGVLRYSYRGGLPQAQSAADLLRLPYAHLRGVSALDARAAMRKAAVVIATGRAALEAMACGAPVVIADHRSAYQGPLLGGDLEVDRRNNYSGRGGVENPSTEMLCEAIKAAMSSGFDWRGYVATFHDSREITKELLQCLQ